MKCAHCPVDADRPCLGEGIKRLCTLAETRPDYRLLLIERSNGTARPIDPRLAQAETCRQHDGCHCDGSATCRRDNLRRTLAQCFTCIDAGENSPA